MGRVFPNSHDDTPRAAKRHVSLLFSLQKERHQMLTASDALLCMIQFVDSPTDVDQLFGFALCLSAKEVINTLWHCIRRCRFWEHECIQTDVQFLCQKNDRFHLLYFPFSVLLYIRYAFQ